MKKITYDTQIADLKLKQFINILDTNEANELIKKLKAAKLSDMKSLSAAFRNFKGSINILRRESDEIWYGVEDENYSNARILLSIISKLHSAKTDLDFNDVLLVTKQLENLDDAKFTRKISVIEYNITKEDYYNCAGTSDYMARLGRFPEHKDRFQITTKYSAYECLKPQRSGGVLITNNIMDQLKAKYDKDLLFNATTEIPFKEYLADSYLALKHVFKGDETFKESLTCELIEVMNKIKMGRKYDFDSLKIGKIKLWDCKGDLDV